MASDARRSVCYVVAYRDPDYVRTRNLRAALRQSTRFELVDATNRGRSWLRYLETIGKALRARLQHNPDIYLLGFRGHEIFWFIRLIAIGKPLVFDEFMSPSDALVSEKKLGNLGQLLGYFLYPMEWLCLRFSRSSITDTCLQKEFIQERFPSAARKLDVVYVGADSEAAYSATPASNDGAANLDTMQVLFYGTFLPLHGMDVLLDACNRVSDKPIEFHIIGGKGKVLADFLRKLETLRVENVRHDAWVDFDVLTGTLIPRADLCIGGPFGGTPQARRVITGKTVQFLSQSKATVVGQINEAAGFLDRENCLLVEQANPEQLARVFEWALEHRAALAEIGRNGRTLFEQRFSTAPLTRQLDKALGDAP